jgi:tRNA A-37 threonylcarbamoyl transferase component Bud32
MTERAIRRRMGGFDWLVAGDCGRATWLARLDQPGNLLLPPAEPLKPPGAPWRAVARVRLGDAADSDAVVKRFRPRNWIETLKWMWRGAPAIRAFELARELEQLGFHTARPLAAGIRRVLGIPREAYLITSYIAAASPLHLANARLAERPRRLSLVRGLARLYAAMHDAGFRHRDPSLANFLALDQPHRGKTIAVIDLDGLRRQAGVTPTEAAGDLRHLLTRGRVSRRERAWFVATYARARKVRLDARPLVEWIGPLPRRVTFPHSAVDEFGAPVAASGSPAVDAATRTLRPPPAGSPGDFHAETRLAGDLRWLARPARLTPAAESILSAPDRFLETGRVLKPSRSSAVSAGHGLVLKRYNPRKWTDRAKNALRGSKARRCFFRGCDLERHGIPTARPVAMAEERRGGFIGRSYLLMEEIPGAVPLGEWRGDRREGLRQVALLVAQLHNQGYSHRDLKGGNVLLGGKGEAYLIDLDGLRHPGRVSERRAGTDLARLIRDLPEWHWRPSRSECARFLVTYCRARGLADWRPWWRETHRLSRIK